MLGHPLITRAQNDDDGLGTILSVIKDTDGYILKGRLLFPTRVKDNLITKATIERLKYSEPLEVFDSTGEKKQLLGAGKIIKENGEASFMIKIISERHCETLVRVIQELGGNAFDRIYPVFPVLSIKEENKICSICDNPIGTNGCEHQLGKVYLRKYCRVKILDAKVQQLLWSGIKQFYSNNI